MLGAAGVGVGRVSLRRSTMALTLVASAAPAFAQELPTATPESVGLSSERLQLATDRLQEHIDAGDIAGVVAAVMRRGQLVYMESLGRLDIESGAPMPDDAIFRIYSMTRPITSLAAMILWEEDVFELDDPVSKYLPQFAAQRVFADSRNPSMDETRPRTREMTVEHLLLHTSGMGSRSSRIYREQGVRLRSISVEEMVDNAARVPLFEDPGTRWRYGISTTVLGRLIEVWSGMPLEDFMQQRIFQPLDMTDTGFWADPSRADRLATVYRPSDDGRLRPYSIDDVPFTERPALIEGGVGLLTSTRDFLRFSQMFLNGGELEGNRVLRPETVALMTVNRVPDSLLPISSRTPGRGWSLGFAVVMDADRHPGFTVSDNEFWWDGSAGTRFHIDPELDIITVIMAQSSPAGGNGFREEFKTLVYAAILDRR